MSTNIIIYIVIFACIAFASLIFIYEYIEERNNLKVFQPGFIIEYYGLHWHGKFKQRNLISSYEILDVDGKYALCKSLKTGKVIEHNLSLDMKYSEMVIKTKDGEIIKEFNNDK